MIYQPAEDSYLLQRAVKQYGFGRVLDMGTGSGIQALAAVENPNVKEVVAVDINQEAVDALNEQIKERKLRKINAIQSDLFENVDHGAFHTIIFNPPYLPEDKREDEESTLATTGGKHGWEISAKFFQQVSAHLFHNGEILFLFSSLTNKEKIEELITKNLLEFEEVEQEKIPHEVLYIYKIGKTKLRETLENRAVEDITYFTHGKRGTIFTGTIDKSKFVKKFIATKKDIIKVGIKIKREESKAVHRIENEAKWLERLNKETIGPQLLFSGENHLVYQFVDGKFILDWLKDATQKEAKSVLLDVLQQCYTMDKIGVNKEEMHHPLKHIVINSWNQPVMLDFERCHNTENPHNVTQVVEFICRLHKELVKKGFTFSVEKLRGLAKEYKETKDLKKLVKAIG
jgi:release factor glutamine methyltransferase